MSIIYKIGQHILYGMPYDYLEDKARNTSVSFSAFCKIRGFKSLQLLEKADWHLSAESSNFGMQKTRKQLTHKAYSLWHLYCLRVLVEVKGVERTAMPALYLELQTFSC